ncbi:MAG TPA: universal stress protein [Nitrososphaeraceae archaeon]|nr:universal stress protein [Nitrososphaeraceae archaeon]
MSSSANQKPIFSKILVTIDSSDASMDAADYATAISQRYNAELYALHVIHADVDLYGPHETSEFTRNMRNEGEKYLNKVKVKANEKDIHIKTEIISSKDISGGILDFAQENNIDLIVIGTRGRSGFKRLLLGIVASHVVTYAHCPVLVIK